MGSMVKVISCGSEDISRHFSHCSIIQQHTVPILPREETNYPVHGSARNNHLEPGLFGVSDDRENKFKNDCAKVLDQTEDMV